MFETFTFGAHPQLSHQLDDALPSPTDASFHASPSSPATSDPIPFHSNQSDLNDIVARLARQTLQQQSRNEWFNRFQAGRDAPLERLEVDDDDEDLHAAKQQGIDMASLPLSATPTKVSSKRVQRQRNVQLQSCPSHLKDINTLVENMISANSQCRITSLPDISPSPPKPLTGGDEPLAVDFSKGNDESVEADCIDEGFCDGEYHEEDDSKMSLRAASMLAGIRKHNIRYARSADVVNVPGWVKVQRQPRMRKRYGQVSRKA